MGIYDPHRTVEETWLRNVTWFLNALQIVRGWSWDWTPVYLWSMPGTHGWERLGVSRHQKSHSAIESLGGTGALPVELSTLGDYPEGRTYICAWGLPRLGIFSCLCVWTRSLVSFWIVQITLVVSLLRCYAIVQVQILGWPIQHPWAVTESQEIQ